MRRSQAETQQTIRKLIEVSRQHFTVHGYAQTVLEDIADEAKLTRGALYHHFGSKKKLFKVVLEEVQKDVAQRIETEAEKGKDEWDQLLMGCHAFVSAAVEAPNKRILLIDGPAVLGWDVWRSLDEQHSMRLLRGQLQLMQESGHFGQLSIDALTHFLSGALNESALWVAQSSDQQEAFKQTMSVISFLLERFR
jgi:AcrR family transcriptional regulator